MNLGKKHLEKLLGFTGSFLCYGTATFVTMVYITDWKVICAYIPFYNKKFKDDNEK